MEDIHDQSVNNTKQLEENELCGCFFCIEVQKSKDVTEFCDGGKTGLCPRCGIDSLLPSVTDLDLLANMNEQWFTNND